MPTDPQTTPETGWLVEIQDPNGKPYWIDVGDAGLTDDRTKATRFCRKQDAEAYIRHVNKIPGLIATEHQWG